MTDFKNRDIISITDFTRDEILSLCQTASKMYDLEKSGRRYSLRDALKNRSLASMFYEPSTRTRTSFNTAIRELGGSHDGFAGTEGTSIMKKETIRDTIMMMESNHFDVGVMRNPLDGSVQWAADVAKIPLINGGDGKNEHPTQSLLDIFTIYMMNGKKLDNISIGFGGDLSHGRTIRSLSMALSHFDNITIRWAAEDFLGMPKDLEDLLKSKHVKVERSEKVRDVMKNVQFYYMTRPQTERMKGVSQKDIIKMMQNYRIDLAKVDGFDLRLMHPLPINSEIAEIDYRVYFRPCQAFFQQAENGIFLRKALLYEMLSHDDYVQSDGTLNPATEFGNNHLQRAIKSRLKEHMFIDNIKRGMVLDHLAYGSAQDIVQKLGLMDREYFFVPASIPQSKKSFIKTDLSELTERECKEIAIRSPDPTINIIDQGDVQSKFVYLLCKNDNCITRAINEDVPPSFYEDEGVIRCRYCRRPYASSNPKVSEAELKSFVQSLPKSVNPL